MAGDRANQYRDRAEEIRACADSMRDPGARETMMRLAESYDRMAQRESAEIKRQSMPKI